MKTTTTDIKLISYVFRAQNDAYHLRDCFVHSFDISLNEVDYSVYFVVDKNNNEVKDVGVDKLANEEYQFDYQLINEDDDEEYEYVMNAFKENFSRLLTF
jgi:hypothetical protein